MSLTLSTAQTTQLQTLLNAADYPAAYGLMELWTRDSTDPDVQLVHTWLLGAADINQGVGPFAALVKAYNQRQGLLRGRPVSAADNQAASNAIAVDVISEAINGAAVPTFAQIVEFDAEGGASLYAHLADNGDSAKANAANWTGTYLISPFGVDETDRLLKTGLSDTEMDTLDDLKNVLFAYDAFKESVWGVKDMDPTLSSWWNAIQAGWDLPEKERLDTFPVNDANLLDNLVADLMRGRTAESAFSLVKTLDKNDVLDQLMSAWQGRVVTGTADETFLATAATFFAGIASATQRDTALERLDGKTASEIAALGQTDAKYRNALLGLSDFALTLDAAQYAARGLELYDSATGTGQITESWLQARSEMLAWKRTFDQRDTPYTDRLNTLDGIFPTPVEGDHVYQDLASGLTLDIDGVNPTTLASHYIRFGDATADTLTGDSLEDRLYGGAGNDTLNAKAGNDYLEGGAGVDTYNTNSGDGTDTIFDSDGQGSIMHNGIALTGGQCTAPNQWTDSQDNTYTLLDNGAGTQNLLVNTGSEQLIIKNYSNEQLGIRLAGEVAPTPFTQSGAGITVTGDRMAYQMPWSTWLWTNNPAWPYLFDSNGNMVRTSVPQPYYADKIFDTAGDDSIYAGDGLNVIYANKGGNNHVQTGANDDYITGGVGRDRVYAGGMTDTIDAGGGDDIVYGEEGGDVIEGGAGNDYLSGGAGADAINGGAGDDQLYGGDSITLAHALSDGGVAAPGQGELMAGGDGNDIVVGSATNDALLGGVGNDTIAGREGNDIVMGDSGLVFVAPPLSKFDLIISSVYWPMGPNLNIHSPFTSAPMLNIQFERIDHGVGNANRYGVKLSSSSNPEAPRDNWMTTLTVGGDDQLDGGSGDDWLFGELGNDVLNAGAGADLLVGGGGNDILLGGAGDDRYAFGPDDGADTVMDSQGSDTLYLGANLTKASLEGVRDGDSMILKIRSTADAITLANWFVQSEGVNRIEFSDGSLLDQAGIEGLLNHAPVAATPILSQQTNADALFTLTVPANAFTDVDANDTLSFSAVLADGSALPSWLSFDPATQTFSGTPGSGDVGSVSIDVIASDAAGASARTGFSLNVAGLDPLAGNDTLYADASNTPLHGGGGDDTLYGSWNSSTLIGGGGNDVLIGQGGPNNVLDGGEGDDTLTGGWGQDNFLGGEGNDIIHAPGGNSVISAGAGNDHIISSWGNDQIDAGGGDDIIRAGGGSNTVRGAQGNDQIVSDQWSDDRYLFGRGDGQDQMADAGGQDSLELEDVGADQLWFSQVGNDLSISLIGTQDRITVQNWYLGSQHHVEQFKTSDGKTLLDSQVQNLVSAMAGFAPPAAGQTTLSASYAASLSPVMAANWQ